MKNFEVEKILESFQHRLEERQGRAEDDKEGIIIDHALSSHYCECGFLVESTRVQLVQC